MILLAVWLILTGALPFLKYGLPYSTTLLSLLAVAAGVLLLTGRRA
jgi:hypothetical protein